MSSVDVTGVIAASPADAWVTVPAAAYRLGDGGRRVRRLDAVRLGRWPVTNAQFARFAAASGHPVPPARAARLTADALADHPVTDVTFDDALAFCAWAGARLPTGDEWEAAARGADGRPYPWGAAFDPDRCACAEGGAWTTAPVGAHPDGASPFGAEDLAGNVWEWVGDPPDADGWRRVRGGCHLDTGWGLRASRALPADPLRATTTTGLRIAWDLEAARPTRRTP
jgi:serine/threonine-protein kinase